MPRFTDGAVVGEAAVVVVGEEAAVAAEVVVAEVEEARAFREGEAVVVAIHALLAEVDHRVRQAAVGAVLRGRLGEAADHRVHLVVVAAVAHRNLPVDKHLVHRVVRLRVHRSSLRAARPQGLRNSHLAAVSPRRDSSRPAEIVQRQVEIAQPRAGIVRQRALAQQAVIALRSFPRAVVPTPEIVPVATTNRARAMPGIVPALTTNRVLEMPRIVQALTTNLAPEMPRIVPMASQATGRAPAMSVTSSALPAAQQQEELLLEA